MDWMKKLALGGATLGLGLGLGLGLSMNTAEAGDGGWGCYVVDRMPDMKEAGSWKGAAKVADGLNEVAAGASSGTVLSVNYPTASNFTTAQSDVGMICVKN